MNDSFWWIPNNLHTVDGRNPANQLISSLSHCLYIPGGAGFLPWTVLSFYLEKSYCFTIWSIKKFRYVDLVFSNQYMVYGQDPPASQRKPEEISEALEIFSISFVRENGGRSFWGPLNMTNWWFQIFFIFNPSWGRFPFWLIFFRWVETTN